MDHAVHYRTAAGETKLEEAGSLDAAVSMVERLRNDEGVSDVRVYRQVPIEFKTYYKVSVVEDGGASGSQAPASSASPAAPVPPQAAASPAPTATAAPTAAPQSPPPGAMPLGPSTPAPNPQPSAQPSAQPSEAAGPADEGESTKKGSLFSRG